PSCAAFLTALDAAREIPRSTRPFRRPLRVVLVQPPSALAMRAQVAHCVEQALGAAGDHAEIECVESRAELFAAVERDRTDIVVVDDDCISNTTEEVTDSPLH